jgi:hypothetical protein
MCSNADRLALIGEAIDQLAADAASGAADSPDRVAGQLAAIWAMMAELDPGLARRLRSYTGEGDGASRGSAAHGGSGDPRAAPPGGGEPSAP